MLEFKKENGFPVDLKFDTTPCAMMEGYISDVYINDQFIETFHHFDLKDRIKYAEKMFEYEKKL